MTAEDVVNSLNVFLDPDDTVEVRILRTIRDGGRAYRRTAAGCFHIRTATQYADRIAAADADPTCSGVYFTPHHLADARRKKSSGWFSRAYTGMLTDDNDVTERRFLLVDIDPVRPANCSATDREKAEAWDVAEAVRAFMVGQSWAAPAVVDSGNGFHLYYRLPQPLPGGKCPDSDPMRVFLRALGAKFDTAAAKIDTHVFNPSRIMRLPGSWSRKGDDTPARPHRQSRLFEVTND